MWFCCAQLLGKESYDIDIAIDNMLGEEFCNKVNEYLKSIDEEVSSVGVILRCMASYVDGWSAYKM